MKRFLAILILIGVIIFLYGRFIEVNDIKVNYYDLDSDILPDSFKELKIVHFSDILYSKNKQQLDKLVKIINDLDADVIIFSGDLFNKNISYEDEDYQVLQDDLKKMEANLYKFAVIGENDEKNIDKYKDLLYDADFNLLDDSNKLLFYKDASPINIIGISNLENIETLLNTDVEACYTIAITHQPDNFDELSNYNINVVLSGHSLGGIVKVPYYGGIIRKEGAEKYINNYYQNNNTILYVSNGLGYQEFNFRLLNNPSINVYRFK